MAKADQLSLSARPRTLDAMVGQAKLVAAIRGHMAGDRVVKAWMFCGPKGTGKTTVSRILALSYQCEHQKVFGNPCKECRANRSAFPIHEIPASDLTGIDDIRKALQGYDYGIIGAGKYRVYVIDEAHRLSGSAQDLLLKYIERDNLPTIFILVSSAPHKIVETLRSRCVVYELDELGLDDTALLVEKLLKIAQSKLPVDRLADALVDHRVRSPRLIAQAVEKYVSGVPVEDAIKVDGAATIDVSVLCRSAVKGDWPAVAGVLLNNQDPRGVRIAVVSYLKTILLESPEIDDRTLTVAKAIQGLCSVQNAEDVVVAASLACELYKVVAMFSKYKR